MKKTLYLCGLILSLFLLITPVGANDSTFDHFDNYNSNNWKIADWTNGIPFNNGWKSDHIRFEDSKMIIQLDNVGCPYQCHEKPFASGEYRSVKSYGYGTYEVIMKPAKSEGIVTSFFIYSKEKESDPWDEIDIEFLGKDTTQVQLNYWTNGKEHPILLSLGFDAAEKYHTYSIVWEPTKITWNVDGNSFHIEDGSRGPLPSHTGKIMMNLWPGIGVDNWLKPFIYKAPIIAKYESVRFSPLEIKPTTSITTPTFNAETDGVISNVQFSPPKINEPISGEITAENTGYFTWAAPNYVCGYDSYGLGFCVPKEGSGTIADFIPLNKESRQYGARVQLMEESWFGLFYSTIKNEFFDADIKSFIKNGQSVPINFHFNGDIIRKPGKNKLKIGSVEFLNNNQNKE